MYSNVFTLICLAGRSSKDPESVHHLKPGDIDVIAAMGDSVTIGAGVTSRYTLEVNIENRGIVGSIGGQGTWRQYLTLPNILKVCSFLTSALFTHTICVIAINANTEIFHSPIFLYAGIQS